jgi:hypothetical protein
MELLMILTYAAIRYAIWSLPPLRRAAPCDWGTSSAQWLL